MMYLGSFDCPICGQRRGRGSDHRRCSRVMQQMRRDKAAAVNKDVSKVPLTTGEIKLKAKGG